MRASYVSHLIAFGRSSRCHCVWLALTNLGTACHAQIASYCATDNVCFKVNVPDASASSGDGDLYFQIQGPSSSQYIGLGQGGSMSGSNIFIVYADASGSNVTLSPRLGHGNFQPDYDGSTQLSLLGGSGIANGQMTANVRCMFNTYVSCCPEYPREY